MKVLFLITKRHPFGWEEPYLEHEKPLLSEAFDKVYMIPADHFGDDVPSRDWPDNFELFHVNQVVRQEGGAGLKKSSKYSETFKIASNELLISRRKPFFFKTFNKHLSVLRHQQALADLVEKRIEEHKAKGHQVFVYCYWIHYGALMAVILKRRGVISDFVVRGHSIDLYHADWHLAKVFKTHPLCHHFITMRSAGLVSAVSQHGADFLKKKFPAYAGKVVCHRLGVPPNAPSPWNPSDTFVIVSCSHLSPNKRVEFIPRILELLNFPVRWIHFGGGSAEQMQGLMAATEGLPANITVELRGNVPNRDILDFYANNQVDLVVNLSMAEGLPVSLMEAISFGIPVMATAVYGSPEVANTETGFSIPSDFELNDVAEKITSLHNDPERYQALRDSARNFFMQNFTADMNYRGFIKELMQHPA